MIRTTDKSARAFPSGAVWYSIDAQGKRTEHGSAPLHLGLSQRAYFAAHAPATPQDWFEPTMATPRPERPTIPAKDIDVYRRFTNDDGEPITGAPVWVRDYARLVSDWRLATAKWDREWEKQRLVQWPWAWADAVLDAAGVPDAPVPAAQEVKP